MEEVRTIEIINNVDVVSPLEDDSIINVLDKGYVRLVDHMGTDLSVVNAARASFAKESKELTQSDARLINFLAREGHLSPFRHAFMTFEMKAPLMVARQHWKYCIGSDHAMDGWNESCFPCYQFINIETIDEFGNISDLFMSVEELYESMLEGKIKTAYTKSYDKSTGFVVSNKISQVWYSGVAEVYKVTLENGLFIETTANHRYLMGDGKFKTLDLITPTDKIYALETADSKTPIPIAIKSIEKTTTTKVYDIEMEADPNLLISNIVVHNSRRYVTSDTEFYHINPDQWRSAPENKKQGSGYPIDPFIGSILSDHFEKVVSDGEAFYKMAMDYGVCAEQARVFLPAYALYVNYRWSASLQSVCNFLLQRLEEDAQKEIQDYAKAVFKLAEPLFPITFSSMNIGR